MQSQTRKTRFVPTTLNPQWNEKFSLCVASTAATHTAASNELDTLTTALGLTFEVWDHDTIKGRCSDRSALSYSRADDYMGECLITLDKTHGVIQDGILGSASASSVAPPRLMHRACPQRSRAGSRSSRALASTTRSRATCTSRSHIAPRDGSAPARSQGRGTCRVTQAAAAR